MINVTQITRKLSMLPDGELKNFAEMHKQDPYTFSLAISESVRRKDLRSAPRPEEQQPTVADQQLSAMTELPEDVGIAALPVDMRMASGGIVAFDDGGYVPKYAGKKESLVDTKKVFVEKYGSVADAAGKALGVDPSILLAQWGMESRWGDSTVGDYNVGNIKDFTNKGPKAFDKVEKSNSAYREYNSPEDFGQDYVKLVQRNFPKAIGSGSDVNAFTSGLQNGRIGAYATDKNYGKTLAKTLTSLLPIGSAQAEEIPSSIPINEGSNQKTPVTPQADRSIGGQFSTIGQGLAGIAGKAGNVIAPEGAGGYTPGTRNFFERAADNLGISEEAQRNVSNTLNALGGGSFGTIARIPKAVGKLSSAAQAAREAEVLAAAAKAEQAAQKVANVRLPAPTTPQGIERLAGSAVAPPAAPRTTFPVGEEALRLKQQQQAAAAARSNQAAKEPSLGAKMELDKRALQSADENAAATFNTARASEAAEIENAARLANATNKVTAPINTTANINATNTGLNALDAQMQRSAFAATDPSRTDADPKAALNTPEAKDFAKDMPVEVKNLEDRYPKKEDLTKKDEKEIIAEAKAFSPELKSRGFTNDDWLQFGLALMAGKSRYALENIGNAGLSAVAGKKEREKEERAVLSKMMDKTDMTKVIDRLMKDDPSLSYRDAYDIYSAGRTALEAKNRGIDVRQDEALTNRIKAYQDGMKEIRILGIIADSPTATPAQKKAYADAKAALGPNPALQATGTQVAPAASTMPALPGAKIVGSRPA